MTQTVHQTWQQPYYSQGPAPAPPPAGPYNYPPGYQPWAAPQRRAGVAGLGLTVAGLVACLASFTTLSWFDEGTVYAGSDRSGSFSLVGSVLSRIQINPNVTVEPVAVHYFSWLAWMLLVVSVAAAVVANLPTRAAGAFRAVGGVVGVAAVGLTFWAIDLLSVDGGPVPDPAYSKYLGETSVGFYAAVGGFAAIGLGAMIGSRRR